MSLRHWPVRALRMMRFIGFYVRNLVSANLQVARTVTTGRPPIRPAVIRYPLSIRSDGAIALFANLISLTPGTLTLDVDEDGQALWVHGLHVSSPDDLRAHLRDLERRLEEALS